MKSKQNCGNYEIIKCPWFISKNRELLILFYYFEVSFSNSEILAEFVLEDIIDTL